MPASRTPRAAPRGAKSPGRAASAAAWQRGDYAEVRRLGRAILTASNSSPAERAAAATELQRLALDRFTLLAGGGSALLLLAAWIWALA